MNLKQCSVKLYIRSQLFFSDNCDMSPLAVTQKKFLGLPSTAKPINDRKNVLKRKRKLVEKVTEMTSYEKMIENNRAERLAFLQSLKINEVKDSFRDSVRSIKPIRERTIKNTMKTSPVRKSRRLVDFNVDLSERSLYRRAVNWKQTRVIEYIPLELTFNEALGSAEAYDDYIDDVKIQVPQSVTLPFLYNRSVLKNMTLDDSDIIRIADGTHLNTLSWYPSADDLILAAGCNMGRLSVFNIESESNPHLFNIHTRGITNLQFSPYNSTQLFSSSYDGMLLCGDMEKQVFSEVFNVSDKTVCNYFDFLSSTTSLVSLKNGFVSLADMRIKQRPGKMMHKCHDRSVRTVSVHPLDKNVFVTAEYKGSVSLWDLRNLRKEPVVDICRRNSLNSAFFSPVSGNSILTTCLNNFVCIFDSTNLTEEIKLTRKQKFNELLHNSVITCRIMWLPNSDETFVIGSAQNFPKRIEIFDRNMNVYHVLMAENLTLNTYHHAFHPFRPIFAGVGHGKVLVFE